MKRGETTKRELERLHLRRKTMQSAFERMTAAYQEQSSIQVARICGEARRLAAIIEQISSLEGSPSK